MEGESITIEGPGGPVGFSVTGSGPALVLVAGLGSTRRIWGSLPAILGQRFTVVCPDNRGVGASRGGEAFTLAGAARDLVAILDHLGLERASLLGASMGGAIALVTARDAPARVERLVLASCAAHLSHHGRASLGLLSRLLELDPPDLVGLALAALTFAPPFHERHPSIIREVGELYGLDPRDVEGARAQARHLLEGWDLRPNLPDIRVPALVVAGRRDAVVSVEDTELLASGLPHATFLELPDAGHSVLAEGGVPVLERIQDFISG